MKRFLSLCFAAAAFVAMPVCMASAQTAQEVMNKFSHEPTIEATMDAAVKYAGLSNDRMDSLYIRAGVSNILPKSVSYTYTLTERDLNRPQKTYTYNPLEVNSDGARAEFDQDNYKSLQIKKYDENYETNQHKIAAQWDLSKLVYNNEQRSVVNTMASVAARRDKILKDLTKAYYARRKAQVDAVMNPPKDVAAKLESDLKIQELTATIDAMTGGWFSAQLRNGRN